ncbi:MAG TPA: DedA family protein [Longilinea sp.]|nr:DedA family protein [Longilinea sp.]
MIQFILTVIDWFLHLDRYLGQIINDFGFWTYGILFVVIFIETGVVIMPFLPGDSLLFAAGAFAAIDSSGLNIFLLYGLMAIAAIIGDTTNYWIGRKIGAKAFTGEVKWLKKEYFDRAHAFYEKHGGKTIFLARFVPIIRTFAPFVAGVAQMRYGYFLSYNLIGGVVWTGLFLFAGYFFGNLSFVEENFSLVILAIIFVSLIPVVIEGIKGRKKKEPAQPAAPEQ